MGFTNVRNMRKERKRNKKLIEESDENDAFKQLLITHPYKRQLLRHAAGSIHD